MLRRNARLRKEYLYRKQLLAVEQVKYDQKRHMQANLSSGDIIANELRRGAVQLVDDMRFDDATTGLKGLDDDEYSNARVPKLLLTTSRDPSSRLKLFVKELKVLFPNTQRVNRGRHVISELVDVARSNGFTDLVIVHETRGNPDGLVVSHLPYGPTAFFNISGVVMRSEVADARHVPEKAPHLVLEGMSTKLGQRIGTILKHLFPAAKEEANRVISFINRQDCIIFRHHIYSEVGGEVLLKEVGPRFTLTPYLVKLDTVDSKVGDYEWRLNTFTNTAKTKMNL